jgi:hypothetical protein
MSKAFLRIGYAKSENTDRGVYEDIIEKEGFYTAEVIRDTRSMNNGDKIVDEINVSNRFSFVADPYAFSHFYNMRYAEYMGVLWRVTDVEVQYPRLIISIGGVYTGPEFEGEETQETSGI